MMFLASDKALGEARAALLSPAKMLMNNHSSVASSSNDELMSSSNFIHQQYSSQYRRREVWRNIGVRGLGRNFLGRTHARAVQIGGSTFRSRSSGLVLLGILFSAVLD